MNSATYYVNTGSQSPMVNRLLQCADLADGACIQDGSGFKLTVSWKKDEVVTQERINKLKPVIQKIFEDKGYIVHSIESEDQK